MFLVDFGLYGGVPMAAIATVVLSWPPALLAESIKA